MLDIMTITNFNSLNKSDRILSRLRNEYDFFYSLSKNSLVTISEKEESEKISILLAQIIEQFDKSFRRKV
jgi:hypothetical protein